MAVEKLNVTFPKDTVEKLRHLIPAGERSHVIAEAVEEKLRVLACRRALRLAAGAWSTRHHADLRSQADINRYLGRLRGRLR
jgi:hypothetical protein